MILKKHIKILNKKHKDSLMKVWSSSMSTKFLKRMLDAHWMGKLKNISE